MESGGARIEINLAVDLPRSIFKNFSKLQTYRYSGIVWQYEDTMLFATPPHLCSSCTRLQVLFKYRIPHIARQHRFVSQKGIQKCKRAADTWASQGKEIEAGTRPSLLSILEERGYVNQIAG